MTVKTSVGQVVRLIVEVDGVQVPVTTTTEATTMINYRKKYISQMCDEGTLIAFKIAGRWLVPLSELKRLTQVRDNSPPYEP